MIMQRRPVDHLDIHDLPVDDVEIEHSLRGNEGDASMAWSIGLTLRMSLGAEALTEVVAAAALGHQAKVPRADGKLALALLLEQRHQFGDKLREDVAHKRMLGSHERNHNQGMTP